MKKYEYTYIVVPGPREASKIIKELNSFGEKGWHPISEHDEADDGTTVFLLERELDNVPDSAPLSQESVRASE